MLVTASEWQPHICAWLSTKGVGAFSHVDTQVIAWASGEPLELVSAIAFSNATSRHCFASIFVQEKKLPRSLLRAGLLYAFSQLKLARLTFIIEEANLASIRFVTNLGAIPEATLRGAGNSGDLRIFALFPENCKLWRIFDGQRFRAEST